MRFVESLGLYGYAKLEPIILGALIKKEPLLLIGEAGSGKSLLLENIATSLNMEFRHYNASLLNYEDLVGIPYPNKEKTALSYLYDESAIWEAEALFIDEINRVKPEMQNKLFPLIYEKRIQGKKLDNLVYRFAAMNPMHEDESELYYEGVSPLDEALADRFHFLINVPSFLDLSDKDRDSLILGKRGEKVSLKELVDKGERIYESLPFSLGESLLPIVKKTFLILNSRIGYLSSRRAKIIYENALYIHAARLALNESEPIDPKDSLELSFIYSLPYLTKKEVNEERIRQIYDEASEKLRMKGVMGEVYALENKEERLLFALRHIDEIEPYEMISIIPDGLSHVEEGMKPALAFFTFLECSRVKELAPSLMETVVKAAEPLLAHPKENTLPKNDREARLVKKIKELMDDYEGREKETLGRFLRLKMNEECSETSLSRYAHQFFEIERKIYA